jgi:hypothetical protein
MVEGILDFGMAGLRKGLRLTGLQENFTDLTHRTKLDTINKAEAIKPINRPFNHDSITSNIQEIQQKSQKNGAQLTKTITSDDITNDDTVWINPLTKESPNFDGHILLVNIIDCNSLE